MIVSNNEKPKITSTQRIYEAVRELQRLEHITTRESVADLTGLPLSIVDDRLRALVDDGELKRFLRGIYEPVEQFGPPARKWQTPLGKTPSPRAGGLFKETPLGEIAAYFGLTLHENDTK